MGNDQSKGSQQTSQYGGIYIKLDRDVFYPGQTVTGQVYLDLRMPYPGDKLCFEIKGKEYTKWMDRETKYRTKADGTQESYHIDVPREGNSEIIKQEITVYDWHAGTVIPPGQFTFPISFLVPSGLPGSFFFMSGGTVAEVSYSVEAFLKPETDRVQKLSSKRQVLVRENLNKTIETKEVKINKEIKTCCCMSQGTLEMKTSFEKTAYAPGEEARVITEIDNSKNSLTVKNVSFSLVQTITISAPPHSRSFSHTIQSLSLGSITAGEKCVGNGSKIGSIRLPSGQQGSSKAFRGDAPVSNYTADPTQEISPSTHGRLVKSDYHLNVVCDMDGCFCCDAMPANSLPVTIYCPERAPIPDPEPPANWRPQQMPQANLTITVVQRPDGGQNIVINQGNQQGQPGQPQPNQNQMVQPSMNNNQQPNYNQGQPNYNQQQPQPNYNQQQQQPQPNYNQQQQPQPNYNQQQQPQPNYNNQQQQQQPNYNNQQQQQQPNYNNQQQQQQPNYNNQQQQQQPNYNNQQQQQQNYNNQQQQPNYNNQQQQQNYNNQQQPQYNQNQGQQNYNNQQNQVY